MYFYFIFSMLSFCLVCFCSLCSVWFILGHFRMLLLAGCLECNISLHVNETEIKFPPCPCLHSARTTLTIFSIDGHFNLSVPVSTIAGDCFLYQKCHFVCKFFVMHTCLQWNSSFVYRTTADEEPSRTGKEKQYAYWLHTYSLLLLTSFNMSKCYSNDMHFTQMQFEW